MKVISCGRSDCLLKNGQRVRHEALCSNYVCLDCGGKLELRPLLGDHVVIGYMVSCGRCGGEEFIGTAALRCQLVTEVTVIGGLPRELQQIAFDVEYPQIAAETAELAELGSLLFP